MADNVRTLGLGPWHYCGRCDEKTKIADMKWQNGVLLCPTCVDSFPATPGVREKMIAAVLNDGKQEYKIHPKLTDSTTDDFLQDDIII